MALPEDVKPIGYLNPELAAEIRAQVEERTNSIDGEATPPGHLTPAEAAWILTRMQPRPFPSEGTDATQEPL